VKRRVTGRFDRRDVEAFLRHARHAVNTGGVAPEVRESIAFRLSVMTRELDEVEPRWELLRAWGRELRELLRTFAHPATVLALDGLRWP